MDNFKESLIKKLKDDCVCNDKYLFTNDEVVDIINSSETIEDKIEFITKNTIHETIKSYTLLLIELIESNIDLKEIITIKNIEKEFLNISK